MHHESEGWSCHDVEVSDAHEPAQRKQLGAWYTPAPLIDHLLDRVLEPFLARTRGPVSVLDPACGDGRFLRAAATRVKTAGRRARLHGIDIDPSAIDQARSVLGKSAQLQLGSALDGRLDGSRFDVVIGNPPFLSQLATATTRGGRSRLGGGAYANSAAEFLALAAEVVRPGGVVGLVLPLSIVSARDTRPIRQAVERSAVLTWCWWASRSVFEAAVLTCAVGLEAGGGPGRPVERSTGAGFVPLPPVQPVPGAPTWGWLVADGLGVPDLPELATAGTLGDRAVPTADFRDEYYGLVGGVRDGGSGPRLVTSGLIDAGTLLWGQRRTRFAKHHFDAPVVDLDALSAPMRRWADQRLVPKVLVANQTRVIEAVADPDGCLLPSVPVVSVLPADPADVWAIAAVLTSPVASAWLARHAAGSGLSAKAVRVVPATLARLPWPAGPIAGAIEALRRGEIGACGRLVDAAYGVEDEALSAWWLSAATGRPATPSPHHR